MTGATLTPRASATCMQLPITITWGPNDHSVLALVDSGAAGNFLDSSLAIRLRLPLTSLQHPLSVTALDGRPLGKGTVTHLTSPITMSTSDHHHESIQFYLVSSPEFPVVLGYPWLSHHSPHINWSTGKIVEWSPACKSSCLLSKSKSPVSKAPSPLELSQVPAEYHDLSEVFNKTRATSLPPHRPFDCAIDLLPGASPPRGRIFSLSPAETQAMETYIKESLEAGLIRPSTSPAGAGFFFSLGRRMVASGLALIIEV